MSAMKYKKEKKLLVGLAAFYWGMVLLIYFVAGDQFRYTQVVSDTLTPTASIGEVVDGMEICQRVSIDADRLDGIDLMVGTYGRRNEGKLHVALENDQGEVLATQVVDLSSFEDAKYNTIVFDQAIEALPSGEMMLILRTEGSKPGNSITLYYGNVVTAGRFDIVKKISQEDLFTINDEAGLGILCAKVNGVEHLTLYKTYWIIMPSLFLLVCGYTAWCWKGMKTGRSNLLTSLCTVYTRYTFLIKQLVNRDFQTKYKRSVLGVVWSFLNPLLSMSVQYVVFSTLFKNDTPNYPVYLLTGIVFFNFFNEAVSTGMTAITSNASLIKKVYMPKYIYPVSKILSSMINFALALIPLLLVMIATGTPLRLSLLLLIFDILCLMGFVTGMALLLSTFMTFFQDTQFLWNVLSLMWMYLTPVFYTENIIPQEFLFFYHMNPMYQYITFARVAIIGGTSPAPTAYLWCMISSIVVLAVGAFVFKKNQDKFVLYL